MLFMIFFTLSALCYPAVSGKTATTQTGKWLTDILVLTPGLLSDDRSAIVGQGHSIVPAVYLAVEQINKKNDMLPHHYLQDVIVRDTGCADEPSKTAVNIVSTLRDQLLTKRAPVSIIGPACSEDSIFAINVLHSFLSIPVFYSGTTPLLDYEVRPGTFGMISSAKVLVETLIKIAERERWSWENVAVLYDDDAKEHYHDTYNALARELNNNLQQVGYTGQVSSSQIPIDEIIERSIRTVIIFSSNEPARQLVCLAGHEDYNFVFPLHQLIFTEKVPEDILGHKFAFKHNNQKTYKCDEETLIRGMNGSIFINQDLDSVDSEVVTVSGYTAGQVRQQYREKLEKYGTMMNISLSASSYAFVYYDAIWAMSVGLHLTSMTAGSNVTSFADVVFEQVSFQGVSNWIDFNNNHHISNPVTILQVNRTVAIKRGELNGNNLSYDSEIFISDEFKTENIVLNTKLAIFGFLSAIVPLIFTGIMQVLTIRYRNYPSFKASSTQLNHFIYVGCYLYTSALLVYTLNFSYAFSSALCNIEVLLSIVSPCLIFGTILVKSWRQYRLFKHVFKTAQSHQCCLHDATMAALIAGLVVIQVLLFIPVVASPLKIVTIYSIDNSRLPPVRNVQSVCTSESVRYISIPFLFQVCVLCVAVFLASLNRNVKRKHFRTTKQILVLVYILAILWAVFVPLLLLSYILNFSVNVTYIIYLIINTVTLISCLIMLLGPSFSSVINRLNNRGSLRLYYLNLFSNATDNNS